MGVILWYNAYFMSETASSGLAGHSGIKFKQGFQPLAIVFEAAVPETYSGQGYLKKRIEPAHIADLVYFLVSPASDMISGQNFAIDGG